MTVLLRRFGGGLAGQDLLGGLLLGLVVVGVADQSVAHTVEHVDDVAEGLVHLAHGVVGRGLGGPAPAGTGDVLARRHLLAGSSSTVWACTSNLPAIDRISCGSVIKRVVIPLSPVLKSFVGCL